MTVFASKVIHKNFKKFERVSFQDGGEFKIRIPQVIFLCIILYKEYQKS